jgi:hypothetical protein
MREGAFSPEMYRWKRSRSCIDNRNRNAKTTSSRCKHRHRVLRVHLSADMSNSKKKGVRLGTRMRGALNDAYDRRGHHSSSLYLVYSVKASRDVVLKGDLEYLHYLHAESDPQVKDITYTEKKLHADLLGVEMAALIDAEVTLRTGGTEWREIKPREAIEQGEENRAHRQILVQQIAARKMGVTHRIITEDTLTKDLTRIENARQIISWIAQARSWPLHEESQYALERLRRKKEMELRQFAECATVDFGKLRASLCVSALMKLAIYGKVGSNLDASPMSARSRFWAAGKVGMQDG